MQPHKAFSSSIGSKFVIALTGLFLTIFLIGHLAGNLLFIAGPDVFNEYSHKLTSNPLVYVADFGLLALRAAHRQDDYPFYRQLRGAPARLREEAVGEDQEREKPQERVIVDHDRHGNDHAAVRGHSPATFKFGTYYETPGGIRDIYRLQQSVFSNPGYVAFTAMGVTFHLWHGASSAMQSFGVNSPTWTPRLQWLGRGLAVIVGLGFAMLPIYTFVLERRDDPRRAHAQRTHYRQVGSAQVRKQAGQSGQPPQIRGHRGRHLAGASAAPSLGELGYNVKAFFDVDTRAARTASRRRAASTPPRTIATTATASTACSTTPSRAATIAPARPTSTGSRRCRSTSTSAAQGALFAREYGGLLDNRSFGGAQVSRTFYARGQTGQQLLLGAYQSLMRQVDAKTDAVRAPRNARP